MDIHGKSAQAVAVAGGVVLTNLLEFIVRREIIDLDDAIQILDNSLIDLGNSPSRPDPMKGASAIITGLKSSIPKRVANKS